MTNGKKGYLGSIRHADSLKDSHGAMGRAFCRRYTLEKASSLCTLKLLPTLTCLDQLPSCLQCCQISVTPLSNSHTSS